jgi:Arc/MetJ family transcription regulator
MGRSSTKKAAANAALAEYAKLLKQRELLQMQGKVPWSGNLDALRANRADRRR